MNDSLTYNIERTTPPREVRVMHLLPVADTYSLLCIIISTQVMEAMHPAQQFNPCSHSCLILFIIASIYVCM